MIRKLTAAGIALLMGCSFAACADTAADVVGVEDVSEVDIEIPEGQELTTDYTDVSSLDIVPGARLAVVAKGMDNAYWQAVKRGAEEAIDDINETFQLEGDDKVSMAFEGTEDDLDEETQINIIDSVISEYPDALCIAAIDMESCQAQLEAAQDNGIPVIMLDSGVESNLVTCNCMTDNSGAAHLAVKKIQDAIDGEGQVLIVAHPESSETSRIRVKEFQAEVNNLYTDIEIADVLYQTQGVDLAEEIRESLRRNKDLKAVFCTNEEVAELTLDVLDEQKREDLILVGFDAGEKQINAVAEGKEYGIVCQNPFGMGYVAVVAAFRAVAGQKTDEFIDSGYTWIDINNYKDEENQKYLYL